MAPISNASRLAEFGSGIGTDGAVIQVDNTNKRVGIGTTNPQATLQVGIGVSVYGNVGIVSATEVRADTLRGDGTNITGVVGVGTLNVRTETVTTSGVSTFAGVTKVTDTTDATSTTTGALIVSGGVGIAKSLHVGQNITIGGTLTYEDVTNVDSIGVVTARSGVNVSGGQLLVGSGITMGIAGVATFSGTSDVHLLDNVRLNVGDGSDLTLYHDASHSYVRSDSVALRIRSGDLRLQSATGEEYFYAVADGGAHIYHDNALKLQTTGDGITVTGEVTADGLDIAGHTMIGAGVTIGSAGVSTFSGTADVHLLDNVRLNVGDGSDFAIYHDSSNSHLHNTTGTLRIRGDSVKINNAAANKNAIVCESDIVTLYYDNSAKLATTNEGIQVTGFTSTTAGMGVTGGLFEGAFIKAGKLSDNKTLGISTANVFYFTTAETTTATPNIVWNDTYALSSKMNVGDVASVTVITTAAAAGYSANWTIDGNAVTEVWAGGSAPSSGGSSGVDVYGLTIIRKASGTGDTGWKVIANVTNCA